MQTVPNSYVSIHDMTLVGILHVAKEWPTKSALSLDAIVLLYPSLPFDTAKLVHSDLEWSNATAVKTKHGTSFGQN
jgi:hypothetical protein